MKATHEEREKWRMVEPNNSSADLTSGQLTNRILGVLIAVAVSMAVFQIVRERMTFDEAFNSLSTELFGAAVTFYALELVVRPKKHQEDVEARKAKLIRDMGSRVNDVALKAVEELREEGWLGDGSLQGANMPKANLVGVEMREARLQYANLSAANLQRAILVRVRFEGADLLGANMNETIATAASLQGARLYRANLQGTGLMGANLQGTDLEKSNLKRAKLVAANLQGTDLNRANLEEADLFGAHIQGARLTAAHLRNVQNLDEAFFDILTILPNGDNWHEGYDLTHFTNPEHEDFWEPDWVKEQREQETKDATSH